MAFYNRTVPKFTKTLDIIYFFQKQKNKQLNVRNLNEKFYFNNFTKFSIEIFSLLRKNVDISKYASRHFLAIPYYTFKKDSIDFQCLSMSICFRIERISLVRYIKMNKSYFNQ
ncbi:hypothetical protein DMUE_0337 [Dictyocoela muelleri]|nr:hypothetical protein DMUE_0337 [Dictyocoela muelleri]